MPHGMIPELIFEGKSAGAASLGGDGKVSVESLAHEGSGVSRATVGS